jgi:hypothetical protein
MFRWFALLLSIGLLNACGGGGGGGGGTATTPPPPPPPPPSGGTQFTKMLVLGGSTASGFQSSGISAATQNQSYGALLARMAGARFAVPELADAGCPAPATAPLGAATSVANCRRVGALPPTTIGQLAAVPQTRVGEALTVSSGTNATFDSLFIGARSHVQVAQQVAPTFLIVHFGDDDVSPAAVTGLLGPLPGIADPQLTEQATFSTQYNQLIGDIASGTIAGAALIGVANPILYSPMLQPGGFYFIARDASNRFEGKLVNANCAPVNGLGQPNPLSRNLVSIRAVSDAGVVEINCDPAMLAAGGPYLVDVQEQAAITQRVDQFNAAISAIATARNWVYFDMNAFLAPLRTEVTASGGYDRVRMCQLLASATTPAQVQAATLTSCPVTGSTGAPNRFGSLVSFDALHPSAELHRLLAARLAVEINTKYGTTVSTTVP